MADLVIGGRRAAVQRPWRAGAIALAMLGVAIVVAWFIYRRSVAYDVPGGEVRGEISSTQVGPGAPRSLTYNGASLGFTGGIPVLRISGDPHAMGAAHGRLLAPYLTAVTRAARPSIEGTVGTSGLFGGWTHGMRLAWRWRFVDDGLVDTDRRWVAGMTRGAAASGVSLSYDDLVRTQAVLDVGAPSTRTAEAEQHGIARSLTVIARQAQAPARLWLGRHFALPGLDDGGDAEVPIVTIAKPEGRIAYAQVGWPGGLGAVTGINASGIVVLVHPVRTSDLRPTRAARPVAHLARGVLEQAETIDQAIKLIEATPTLGAAVFVLADSTGAWVVVERTPSKSIVERAPKMGALGDVLTTNALASDPENDRSRRTLSTMGRVTRAEKLVREPLPDVAAVAAILRDRKTVDDTQRAAGHRGVIADGRSIHTVIIDPTSLELWVSDPAAAGRMRGFDLRHELRAEGNAAAPPADIAPDPAVELEEAAALAAARADLRTARGALHAGNFATATEACARARARAPALPEGLVIEGQIAQARGQLDAARSAFQQWIDGGADDPRAEERARALLAR